MTASRGTPEGPDFGSYSRAEVEEATRVVADLLNFPRVGRDGPYVQVASKHAAAINSAAYLALRSPVAPSGEPDKRWVSAEEADFLFDALESCALNKGVEEAGTIAANAIREHATRKFPAAPPLAREDARDGERLDFLEREVQHPNGIDIEHEKAVDYPGCTPRPAGFSVMRTRYTREDNETTMLADREPTLRIAIDAARAATDPSTENKT